MKPKTQSKIEEDIDNLLADDSVLSIETIDGQVGAVVNIKKLVDYVISQQSSLLDRVLEIVGEDEKVGRSSFISEPPSITRNIFRHTLKSAIEAMKGEL